MCRVAGALFVFSIFSLASATAQSPQYRHPAPAQEECPQGRQIRTQKAYPSTMTDCEVLDADTAAENQKLQRKPAPAVARQPPKAPVAAAPAIIPAAPAAPVAVTAAPPPPQAAATPLPPPATHVERPAATPEPQRTDYEDRLIGNWLVSAKQDRFGDGGTFIAITGDGAVALVIRCLQKDLSIGVIEVGGDPKPMGKGDFYKLKFRVDTQPIVDAGGLAISERLIQVVTDKSLVKSIRDGKETALRLEDDRGVSSTHIFNTKGSRSAFADLSRECPLD
jgi:hypothetical protein